MSHCVPDWDGNGGELDAIIPATDFLPPVKGKWESLPQKRRDYDAAETPWTENGHIAMQGQGNKGNKPQWQQVNYNNWSSGQDSEDAVTPLKPPNTPTGKDGGLVMNEPVVDTPPVHSSSIHDDEMVSWLQYPLDDSLERNYCSDFFGELPNSNMSNIQLLKDSVAAGQMSAARFSRNPGPASIGNHGSLNRAASADAAMAMGAGRAAGLIPQAGVEAFTKVRTTMQQPYTVKGTTGADTNVAKSVGAAPTSLSPATRAPPVGCSPSSTMLPPVVAQGSMLFSRPKTMGSGSMNFSHFSRPAYMMRANLQHLGMSHGVTASPRLRNSLSVSRAGDASTSSGSSIAESTTTRQESGVLKKDNDIRAEGSGQQNLGTESSWPSMQNSLTSKESEVAVNSVVGRVESDLMPVEHENGRNSSVTDSGVQGADKPLSEGPAAQDAPEPTVTTSSRGSGNSADRGKEAASSGKRRPREGEESECQSDDVEDDMTELKKPQRSSTTKRSRAAEVHNMSERRRRDRINEKMKALQELIPNSNKTDKASMLDEAIEYLKMLQLQLQMMSMRSGMSIPSMVMPSGMQHLQISPMGHMPPMGMGMGPMVGMGMGMMDMGVVTPGRATHMMPLPPQGGPSHSVSATSPAVSIVDSHDHRLQNNSVMESLNIYLARQQQLQMPQQPIKIDVYNAYIMHQQQQQQLQHQLHHLPSNMGSGPPQ